MNLLDLNEDELKIFLEDGIPLDIHRDLYIHNSKIAQKLKGFRPNTAPLTKLSQTSYALIRKEKNNAIITFFMNFYEDYKSTLKSNEKKLIDAGYPESIAYATSITKGYTEKFLPIYFKLEGINDESQKRIINDSKIIDLIETIVTKKIDSTIKSKLDSLDKMIEKLNQQMSEKNHSISNDIDDISTLVHENCNGIKNIIKNIEDFEKKYVDNDFFSAKFLEIEDKMIDLKIKTNDMIHENNTSKIFQQEIELIKNELFNTKTKNIDGFIVESIVNDEYVIMDNDLSQIVGDVIENISSGSIFDVFREYLLELLYSNKPIICSSKNIQMFLNVISSIISGGNYHVISIDGNFTTSKLIKVIESLPTVNGNKVVLFKNIINVSNYTLITDYISSRPISEKFIFEIMFDKEILFMPKEVLNYFHFYLGNIKDGKVIYKFSYNFDNDNRKPIIISDFVKSIEMLGVQLINKEVYNAKFYGILAYSIIPFLSINDDIDILEITNKLTNHAIRNKCEMVINDK